MILASLDPGSARCALVVAAHAPGEPLTLRHHEVFPVGHLEPLATPITTTSKAGKTWTRTHRRVLSPDEESALVTAIVGQLLRFGVRRLLLEASAPYLPDGAHIAALRAQVREVAVSAGIAKRVQDRCGLLGIAVELVPRVTWLAALRRHASAGLTAGVEPIGSKIGKRGVALDPLLRAHLPALFVSDEREISCNAQTPLSLLPSGPISHKGSALSAPFSGPLETPCDHLRAGASPVAGRVPAPTAMATGTPPAPDARAPRCAPSAAATTCPPEPPLSEPVADAQAESDEGGGESEGGEAEPRERAPGPDLRDAAGLLLSAVLEIPVSATRAPRAPRPPSPDGTTPARARREPRAEKSPRRGARLAGEAWVRTKIATRAAWRTLNGCTCPAKQGRPSKDCPAFEAHKAAGRARREKAAEEARERESPAKDGEA